MLVSIYITVAVIFFLCLRYIKPSPFRWDLFELGVDLLVSLFWPLFVLVLYYAARFF